MFLVTVAGVCIKWMQMSINKETEFLKLTASHLADFKSSMLQQDMLIRKWGACSLTLSYGLWDYEYVLVLTFQEVSMPAAKY